MGVPDHLTCLLRNQVKKEATVRTGHGMTDWFQMEKEVWQGYKWSPCSFNFDVEATVHGPTELDMTERLSKAQSESESCSAMSNSLLPHGLHSSWDSPGQNTGVGSLSLLQQIFPSQELNWDVLHCRWILYQLSYQGSPQHRVHHAKCQAGWITKWNQDCWEKYQQPQICRGYHSMAESEEELKSLLMRVQEESEKADLKFNIEKIMTSSPTISWKIEGE